MASTMHEALRKAGVVRKPVPVVQPSVTIVITRNDPWGEVEKKRVSQNRCYTCGEEGHVDRNCPYAS